MNVASPHWASFRSRSRNPLTPVLAGAFAVPRGVPGFVQMLLNQLDREPPQR
jgi:hypothetical protein